jgi:hypothetical protein
VLGGEAAGQYHPANTTLFPVASLLPWTMFAKAAWRLHKQGFV